MKIVFVTENEISPMLGGTERITSTLASTFMARGHECVSVFFRQCGLPEKSMFSDKRLIDTGIGDSRTLAALTRHRTERDKADLRRQLAPAIAGAGVVISNLVDIRYKRTVLPELYTLTRASGAVLLACYHAMPGEELIGTPVRNCLWHIRRREHVRRYLREMALALTPRVLLMALRHKYIRSRYTLMYDNSDRVVLLSERFTPQFARLAGLSDTSRVAAVPNALSFDAFLPEEAMADKRKEVLIVSRLDEKSKRLSRALEIWGRVRHEGWRLVIVGSGPDAEYYRETALRLHLRDVAFVGRQPDLTPYYRRASIFMMTSEFEGWGITLTEAQQMGVVPIAYDSYASLRDIVEDGVSGIIVPRHSPGRYARKLQSLMRDGDTRRRMALAGQDACRRFTMDAVADSLEQLFAISR